MILVISITVIAITVLLISLIIILNRLQNAWRQHKKTNNPFISFSTIIRHSAPPDTPPSKRRTSLKDDISPIIHVKVIRPSVDTNTITNSKLPANLSKAMSSSTIHVRAIRRQAQAVNGISAAAAAGSGTEVSGAEPPSIRVKFRRVPQQRATPPPGLADPIRLPDTVQIFHRQTECKICMQDIRWSSRQTGWVRCLATNRLVHGHCQHVVTKGTNWCAICDGPCASGRPMRVEGLDV